jgi:hypothetical protein
LKYLNIFVSAKVLIPVTKQLNGMNTLAYILYLFVTYLITVRVGFIFYRNGRIFILNLLQQDTQLTDFINRILLTGYYLLNLGYAALMLRSWDTIHTWTALLLSITTMTGKIMLTLALIPFCNMAVIYFIGKRNHHFATPIKP